MTNQIVLAFTPSNLEKDWNLRNNDGWFLEPQVAFYDTGCGAYKASCPGHSRMVGREPYYNLETREIVVPPRIHLDHHPKKGEWEHWKTIDDVKASPLYVSSDNCD